MAVKSWIGHILCFGVHCVFDDTTFVQGYNTSFGPGQQLRDTHVSRSNLAGRSYGLHI